MPADKKKLYHPTTTLSVERLIEKARRTNDERDALDRQHRFTSPSDCPLGEQLRTTLSALAAALVGRDWTVVAEAYCLLQDTEAQVRTQP